MPRLRTIDDDAVLDAAMRIVARLGPTAVTFASVAEEVGLAPATVVQRFGSKRRLLLAAAARGWDSILETFSEARRSHDSPLDALRSALVALTGGVRTREAMANSIAFLHIDLSDPEFHAHSVAGARQMRERIQALLTEAVEAGELAPGTDAERLARAVQTTYNGSLITWAIDDEGSVEDRLRAEVDLLLEGFRPGVAGRSTRPAGASGGCLPGPLPADE